MSAFWGDLGLRGDVRLCELAALYGAEFDSTDAELTAGELFLRTFQRHPDIGDRLTLGPVELVARQLGEDGSVTEIGLVLEGLTSNEEVSPDLSLAGSLFRRLRRPPPASPASRVAGKSPLPSWRRGSSAKDLTQVPLPAGVLLMATSFAGLGLYVLSSGLSRFRTLRKPSTT